MLSGSVGFLLILAQAMPSAAKPSVDLGTVFSANNYPAAALRAEVQGKVVFGVEVSPEGRVVGCRITSSSGSPDLDAGTCSLMMRLVPFRPARDASGKPVTGHWAGAVNWTLPPAPPPPDAAQPVRVVAGKKLAPPSGSFAPLNEEFEVTADVVTTDTDFARQHWYEIQLRGRAGDRFLVEWRGTQPLNFQRSYDDTSAEYPPNSKFTDLSSSVTLTLKRDGDHVLAFGQIGVTFDPSPPGALIPSFNGRKERPLIPYKLRIRKLN